MGSGSFPGGFCVQLVHILTRPHMRIPKNPVGCKTFFFVYSIIFLKHALYSSELKTLITNQDMDLFHPFAIMKSEASNILKGMKFNDRLY